MKPPEGNSFQQKGYFLIFPSICLCLVFQQLFSAFNLFGTGFAFAIGVFAIMCMVSLNWTPLGKIKNMLQCDPFFPGNPDLLS